MNRHQHVCCQGLLPGIDSFLTQPFMQRRIYTKNPVPHILQRIHRSRFLQHQLFLTDLSTEIVSGPALSLRVTGVCTRLLFPTSLNSFLHMNALVLLAVPTQNSLWYLHGIRFRQLWETSIPARRPKSLEFSPEIPLRIVASLVIQIISTGRDSSSSNISSKN